MEPKVLCHLNDATNVRQRRTRERPTDVRPATRAVCSQSVAGNVGERGMMNGHSCVQCCAVVAQYFV